MVNYTVNNPFSRRGFLFMVIELDLAYEDGVIVPDTNVSSIDHLLGNLLKILEQVLFLALILCLFRPIKTVQ